MGGVAFAGEDSGVLEDDGGGADGGEAPLGGGLGAGQFEDFGIFAEVTDAGAAGEDDEIEFAFGEGVGEEFVGDDLDAGFAGYEFAIMLSGNRAIDLGAAENVDYGDGFDFFETFGQNQQSGFHKEWNSIHYGFFTK